MIYFIACKDAGLVKIGHTGLGAVYRLNQLQMASPFDLEVLGIQDGGRDVEKQMHERFRASHFKREWFRLTEDILEHVRRIGGVEQYHIKAKTYLRELIGQKATKAWTKQQRAAFRDLHQNHLSRSYNRWREFAGNLADADEQKILNFLTANGLLSERAAA